MSKTSQYKYVSFNKTITHGRKVERWRAALNVSAGQVWACFKTTEREAALAVDKKLIELGREPVNILKPKSKEHDK